MVKKGSSKDIILYPTEWVGLRYTKTTQAGRTEITFVQVAYPILPKKPVGSNALLVVEQYKVFLSKDDYEIVDSLELIKLEGAIQSASGVPKLELDQSQPDKELGQIWMKQVDIDFKILEDLYEHCQSHPELKLYATICYLAQQVAENP